MLAEGKQREQASQCGGEAGWWEGKWATTQGSWGSAQESHFLSSFFLLFLFPVLPPCLSPSLLPFLYRFSSLI